MDQIILDQVEQIITEYRRRFDNRQISNPFAAGLPPESWAVIQAKLARSLPDYLWLAEQNLVIDDFTRLSCYLLQLPALRQRYAAKQISDQVFYDTLADLFLRIDTAAMGLNQADFAWLSRIFTLTIFKLDQLQFEMTTINLADDHYQLDVDQAGRQLLPPGTPVLSIHIMAGSDVAPQRSRQALAMASDFFAAHFPAFDYRFFWCYSWLLYDGLAVILPPDSHIRQFQQLFTILAKSDFPDFARERIFAIPYRPDLDRETSLQRQARAHPEALGIAMGIIRPGWF